MAKLSPLTSPITIRSSLFIIHEWRVRGFDPFSPVEPDLLPDTPWQNWITADGVVNESGSIIRARPRKCDANESTPPLARSHLTMTGTNGGVSGQRSLGPPSENLIAEILAARRAMPSWKACRVEGTSWTGTAEENIRTYVSTIGVEDG